MGELQNRLDYFEQELLKAESVLRRKEGNVKRAETARDKAYDDVYTVMYHRDLALIESWGDKPDWGVLLYGGEIGESPKYSSAMYEVCEQLVSQTGLSLSGCVHGHTNQRGIRINFETKELSELNKLCTAVEFFLPLLDADNGRKDFMICQPKADDYHLSLSYEVDSSKFLIRKEIYGAEQRNDRLIFDSCREALRYIQHELSGHDYIEPENNLLEVG